MEDPDSTLQDTQTSFLTELESKQILEQAGLTITHPALVCSSAEAVSIARKIGYPVVLKIVSPDIVHKSDAGGVITGITGPDVLEQAYASMMDAVQKAFPHARIESVSVQPQAPSGLEVIIGMTRDQQFGPAIMFGLGGVWVELMTDVSIRIAPLTREDAAEMVREIKGYKLLQGFRGSPKVDTDTLEEWLLKISDLAMRRPDIRELDINPVFAYPEGAVAVDARILLGN